MKKMSKTNKIIKNVKRYIAKHFKNENTGHDQKHLLRVYANAKQIQKIEGGNKFVILIAALVHDFHRLMSKTEYISPRQSLPMVKKSLEQCGVPKEFQNLILEIVAVHENKLNKDVNLETKVVMDADALDSLGKIGLNRTLKYCKTKNIPIINRGYRLDCKEYVPNINPISTCHYIYRTMINNGKNMKTETGQKLANKRIKVLENFLKSKLGVDYMNIYDSLC